MRCIKQLSLCLSLFIFFACTEKKIDYLGLTPVGLTAEEFAPGIVSTDSFEHSSPVFSPDGTVVLWNQITRVGPDFLLEMTLENGKWSAPHKPSFGSPDADDYYPSFASDGTLYFSSRRKGPAGYERSSMRIWSVTRAAGAWTDPVPFDSTVSKGREFAHSITSNGVLYFSATPVDPAYRTSWNIHRSESNNKKYTGVKTLPFGINSINYEDGACISPDESYLIFESSRSEGIEGSIDLYVSFRMDDDRWSLPINLGPTVNSPDTERMAKLSPDGKYLFFGSNREQGPTSWGFDIYWVETKVIEDLRKSPLAKVAIDQPLGDNVFKALDSGDAELSKQLLREWIARYPDHIEGTRTLVTVLINNKNLEEAEAVIDGMKQEWKDIILFKTDGALIKFGLGKNEEAAALAEQTLAPAKERELRCVQLVSGLSALGLDDLSDQYFDRFSAEDPRAVHVYNRACGYSNAGKKDRAFKYLDRAADLGYNKISQYENDPDLSSLKADPRWKKLRSKLK